jgi:hypothetical protein
LILLFVNREALSSTPTWSILGDKLKSGIVINDLMPGIWQKLIEFKGNEKPTQTLPKGGLLHPHRGIYLKHPLLKSILSL